MPSGRGGRRGGRLRSEGYPPRTLAHAPASSPRHRPRGLARAGRLPARFRCGQRPRRAGRDQRPDPLRDLHPAERAARGRAHRPQGADRRGQRLVPRGQQGRGAGPHGLRAPVRAPDVPGLGELEGRVLRTLRAGRRHRPERHHQQRPHELLPERAHHRARPRAVDGVGPHGPLRRRDFRRPARRAAWRGAEREAPGREPALRPRVGFPRREELPGRPPLQLGRDRLDGRPQRRLHRGREALVLGLVRPEQCRARAGR